MNNLKSFNQFLENNNLSEYILSDVKDILLELEDSGFVIYINKDKAVEEDLNKIVIDITKSIDRPDEEDPELIITEESDFNLSEIQETVYRLNDYLSGYNYRLFYCDYFYYYKDKRYNKVISKDNFTIPNEIASQFRISFVKDAGLLLKRFKERYLATRVLPSAAAFN